MTAVVLGPQLRSTSQVMMLSAHESLDSLLTDEYQAAMALVEMTTQIQPPPRDYHQLIALAAFARLLSHFRVIRRLLEDRALVEARTLTRSCTEVLFLLAALAKDPEPIVAEMKEEDIASRRSRGEFMIRRKILTPENADALQNALARLRNELTGRRRELRPESLSLRGDAADAYIAYLELSGDAAHPTLWSLARYLTEDEAFDFDFDPPIDEEALFDTKALLSMAFLSSIVGFAEILDIGFGDDRLMEMWQRHKAIVQAGYPH